MLVGSPPPPEEWKNRLVYIDFILPNYSGNVRSKFVFQKCVCKLENYFLILKWNKNNFLKGLINQLQVINVYTILIAYFHLDGCSHKVQM